MARRTCPSLSNTCSCLTDIRTGPRVEQAVAGAFRRFLHRWSRVRVEVQDDPGIRLAEHLGPSAHLWVVALGDTSLVGTGLTRQVAAAIWLSGLAQVVTGATRRES